MGVVAAVAGVIGTASSIQQGRQAAKQQKKAAKTQQRLEEFRSAREKRKQVRQAMVLRAEIANQAAVTGTSGSSGAAGGMAGVQSRAASNIFSMNMQEGFGRTISGQLGKAASAQSNAATAGAIGSTAMTIFQGYNKPKTPDMAGAMGDVDLLTDGPLF
jgi:ATPase subunit of ABC transporter with duplicated ATPase domains